MKTLAMLKNKIWLNSESDITVIMPHVTGGIFGLGREGISKGAILQDRDSHSSVHYMCSTALGV